VSFPNDPDKHQHDSALKAEDVIAYRKQLGRLPAITPPEGVILCLQKGLPERRRIRWRHPYRRAGKLMGDLYLLKKTDGKVAVLTNFGIGAPLVAALAEELIAFGVKRLVAMSWAGGLQPDLKPGDIVVCHQAIRDEGTSHHYLPPAKHVQASPALVQALAATFSAHGHDYTTGTTWTTDAPYRETCEEIQRYQSEGVKTVEMESAALFAVGQVRGVQTASVLVVGDSLANLRWQAPPDVNPVERALEAVYAVAIEVLNQ
jgi:uridine phosphorylase